MLPYVIGGTVGGAAVSVAALRYMFPWLKDDLSFLRKAVKIGKLPGEMAKANKVLVDIFEEHAKNSPNKPLILFEEKMYTYEYIDRQATKVANLALSLGFKQRDTAAILMHNSPEFIWTFLGLSKIGVAVSLLNYNLKGKSLLHCFRVSGAKLLIVGKSEDLLHSLEEVKTDLSGVQIFLQGSPVTLPNGVENWDSFHAAASEEPISKSARNTITMSDTLCYIYTSGTTGLPKAAIITQLRFIMGANLGRMAGMDSNDIIYSALPLYHTAGFMLGFGPTLINGATMALRSKFSASHFWEDCRRYNATATQYIGELCRYLLATPKHFDEDKHSIRLALGNGLRPDIWEEFKSRFNIPQIVEFYGATEGNVGFVNLLNKTGAVGRCTPLMRKLAGAEFIKFDVTKDAEYRNSDGFCELVKGNEPGLLIGKIQDILPFVGYKGNRKQTESKILRNVFKNGDAYFNTGDLMTVDKDYYVYFKDRTGDTFRWKGENVSTFEVGSVISQLPWICDANVYGVQIPGSEGRAGMVALTLESEQNKLDINQCKELFEYCSTKLPRYAVPMFVRLQKQMPVTSTFKQLKSQLVKEGFDPQIISDELYFEDSSKKCYVPLTMDLFSRIIARKSRL